MIIARAILHNGTRIAVIGLTRDNLTQLLNDKGIVTFDATIFPDGLMVMFGDTDADIVHTLHPFIDADTHCVNVDVHGAIPPDRVTTPSPPAAAYPADWPRCACGAPVLDGHLTCGRLPCHEGRARDRRAGTWASRSDWES